jgi:hypothetical protein
MMFYNADFSSKDIKEEEEEEEQLNITFFQRPSAVVAYFVNFLFFNSLRALTTGRILGLNTLGEIGYHRHWIIFIFLAHLIIEITKGRAVWAVKCLLL